MEELVLKREASVTSAEALDEIAANYPDAEILSFRKIKEAGVDEQYFIARLRLSAIEEAGPVEEDSGDKLDQILEIVKEILDNETTETDIDDEDGEDVDAKSTPMPSLEIEDPNAHERKPLPSPQKPVLPSASQTQMSPLASLVVQRDASVPKKIARIELLREFGDKYQIANIEKIGAVYVASLISTADSNLDQEDDEDRDAYLEDLARGQAEQEQEAAESAEAYAEENEQDSTPQTTRYKFDYSDPVYNLAPRARQYMMFLDEEGMSAEGLKEMLNWFGTQSAHEQKVFVRGMRQRSRMPGAPDDSSNDSAAGLRGVDRSRGGMFGIPAQLMEHMGPVALPKFKISPEIRKYLKTLRDQKRLQQEQSAETNDPRYPADKKYPDQWYEYVEDQISRVEGDEKQKEILRNILQGTGPEDVSPRSGPRPEPRRPRPSSDVDIRGKTVMDLAQDKSLSPGQVYKALQNMNRMMRTEQLREKAAPPAPNNQEDSPVAVKENPSTTQTGPSFFFDPQGDNRTYPAPR